MKDVPRSTVLRLRLALSKGDIPTLEQEAWESGYGSRA